MVLGELNMTKVDILSALAGAVALVGFAMIFIVALIGLMPDAHAADCFQKSDGRIVCCTIVAGFPYCN
jgi:hypothetical protein